VSQNPEPLRGYFTHHLLKIVVFLLEKKGLKLLREI